MTKAALKPIHCLILPIISVTILRVIKLENNQGWVTLAPYGTRSQASKAQGRQIQKRTPFFL